MSSKLYIGNLSFHTTESTLRTTCEAFGTVTEVNVASDPVTGRARGFGFVTFSNASESKAAIDALNGKELDGRTLTVNEARPREESGSRRPSGGGGSGWGAFPRSGK